MLNQVKENYSYEQDSHQATDPIAVELTGLVTQYGHLEAEALLEPLIADVFNEQIAVSSSFGAESAILLHMVSKVDKNTPVIFMDTGKLFQKTIEYRDQLADVLGLTNVRIIKPSEATLAENDPDGTLWQRSTDACCEIRKVIPFDEAIKDYRAIVTGRKRYQANTRTKLDVIEHDGKQFKVNPVATWDISRLQSYMEKHNLPAHPLVAEGYLSIGCEPCTSPVKEGEDPRAGRWRGEDKTECGIHFVNGKLVRTSAPA